jgi:hypothetical protein
VRHAAIVIPLAFLIALAACATTIPAADATPPSVELTITGPGIGSRTMTNPPREVWTATNGAQYFDLPANSRYNFRLVVSDAGGVARAVVMMPREFVVSNLNAGVTQTAEPLMWTLTAVGTRADPRNGLVITGSFQTAGNLSFEFLAEGADFGGTAGTPNRRGLRVNVAVGN